MKISDLKRRLIYVLANTVHMKVELFNPHLFRFFAVDLSK